ESFPWLYLWLCRRGNAFLFAISGGWVVCCLLGKVKNLCLKGQVRVEHNRHSQSVCNDLLLKWPWLLKNRCNDTWQGLSAYARELWQVCGLGATPEGTTKW